MDQTHTQHVVQKKLNMKEPMREDSIFKNSKNSDRHQNAGYLTGRKFAR